MDLKVKYQKDFDKLEVRILFYEPRENGYLVFNFFKKEAQFVPTGNVIPPYFYFTVREEMFEQFKKACKEISEF